MKKAKENSFKTEIQSIMKATEKQYMIDSMINSVGQTCYDASNLDASFAGDLSFKVEIDETGSVKNVLAVKLSENLEGRATNVNDITLTRKEGLSVVTCESKVPYLDGTISSAPELGNLIPIKYDGTKWVYADITQEWYDYASREWANAVVLADGESKRIGDTITEDEIDLWFVWVPRYEYKIPEDSIGTTGTPNAIEINFISSTVETASNGYKLHPGFAWDSDWTDGITTWKSGIWIGKFESNADETTTDTNQVIKIKANTVSWRKVQIVNMYNSSLDLKNDYSLTGLDSHMTRYTEWTSVSYLTNSIYGRCTSNASCEEVSINDNASYYTGDNDYKTNVAQSTTGNITGIYDMNGGAWEHVMGYLDGDTGSSGFTTLPTDNKYTDIFNTDSSDSGAYASLTNLNGNNSLNGVFKELMSDATKTTTWYSDYSWSILSGYPWFRLGGYRLDSSSAGIFASGLSDAGLYPTYSFRVALVYE